MIRGRSLYGTDSLTYRKGDKAGGWRCYKQLFTGGSTTLPLLTSSLVSVLSALGTARNRRLSLHGYSHWLIPIRLQYRYS